ncbi:killer toxin sensitivity protein [Cladophialophora carrionii]|uniref:Elongator complex protein 5 n=1 Tax=Cladophialophora carrionii TaxID=86049 RepID=A0A1C1CPN7_9EURO|nr:killer toxin sensitivity protein [Cladophialophora carrionii]
MAHTNLQHRRTHNLLLISKLLSQQSQTSPFTLVLDSLEQPAWPLLREYLRRAKLSKLVTTVFLAFETVVKPENVDYFLPRHDVAEGTSAWQKDITRDFASIVKRSAGKRVLVIVDSMTTLASLSTDPACHLNLTAFLSSLLQPPALQSSSAEQEQPPQVSLVTVYHTDVPLPPPHSYSHAEPQHGYSPSPLSLLSYLATTVITVHSLAILLAEKVALAKSLAAPSFGLSGEIEGVIIGLKPKPLAEMMPGEKGIVLELEHRRKSGRGVREWFFLPTTAATAARAGGAPAFRETVILLDDHPQFRRPKEEAADGDQELSGMTFELGLTERQRLEREGVVLPYFDAQKAGGGGEGGRILYDMGVEDDFDEEEDEI